MPLGIVEKSRVDWTWSELLKWSGLQWVNSLYDILMTVDKASILYLDPG